jgi:hypothetical protein
MTNKYEKGLSDRQKHALPYFAGSGSYEEGCRKAGVSKNAFYTWLQNPSFKAELTRMQDEVVVSAVQTLKSSMARATDTLVSLLERKENPTLLRYVCNDIIGHVVKFKELQEIEKRVEALEELQHKNEGCL